MRKKITLVALCLFLLCSFAACGGGTARYEAQAAQMLNAIYYEDVEAAYALLHPEIGVTQEDYEKGFVEYIGLMAGVTWDHYEVLRVDTEGSLAEGKEYQESCRFAVTLRDEREMTLEYVYVKNSQGEGFMSFSLAGSMDNENTDIPSENEQVQHMLGNSSCNDFSIGEVIDALEYDPDMTCAFQGNTATNYVRKNGMMFHNQFVIETQEINIYEKSFKPAITAANAEAVYPGALFLANNEILSGNPQPLNVKRGKTTLLLNFADGSEQVTLDIAEANSENTQDSINNAAKEWYDGLGGQYKLTNGMAVRAEIVYDSKMLQLMSGIDETYIINRLQFNSDDIASGSVAYCAVEYKEIAYTASVSPFESPINAFDPSVTADQLLDGGVNNGNPPAYASEIGYGRRLLVILKSSASPESLKEYAEYAFRKDGMILPADSDKRFEDVIKATQIMIHDMSEAAAEYTAITNDVAVDLSVAVTSEFSAYKPAVPLEYKVAFLKDNADIDFNGTTEYVTINTEVIENGEICLTHDGWYVAEFYVSWDEITGFDEKGNPITKRCQWDGNGTNRERGYEERILLSGNCTNISIEARGNTGLVWEPWRTSFKQTGLKLVKLRELTISGTTLNQKAECTPKDY